jgi:hypothetical protein
MSWKPEQIINVNLRIFPVTTNEDPRHQTLLVYYLQSPYVISFFGCFYFTNLWGTTHSHCQMTLLHINQFTNSLHGAESFLRN